MSGHYVGASGDNRGGFVTRRRACIACLVVVGAYISAYAALTRGFPQSAQVRTSGGTRTAFWLLPTQPPPYAGRHPMERGCYCFFYPLIAFDAMLTGRLYVDWVEYRDESTRGSGGFGGRGFGGHEIANSHRKCNGTAPEDLRRSPVAVKPRQACPARVEAFSQTVVQDSNVTAELPVCQVGERHRLRQVLSGSGDTHL